MAAMQKVVLRNFGSVYRARPAFVIAEPNDKIRFLNYSDRSIQLSFPNGPFAAGQTIEAGGGWDATVPANAAAGNVTYVGVILGVANTELQGESSPEIIIDRFGISMA